MKPLVPAAQYLELVLAGVQPLEATFCDLAEAYGRTLAADLMSPHDLPPFPSAAMDGFAVDAGDLARATPAHPAALRIAGEVRMGRPADLGMSPGSAVAVPTGGMLPAGATAVVPFEECRVETGIVLIATPSPAGRNIRPAGEDLRRGEVVGTAWRRLEAADLGALAAAGFAEVPVRARPRVAMVSTGDELVAPGNRVSAGQIYESNSYMLRALAQLAGAEVVHFENVRDDPATLLKALDRAATGADAIVCSGGISAGRNDPVKRAFAETGRVSFVRVAVQPGKPQAFGTYGGKPLFGVPGNPMAALVSFLLFVNPALKRLAGDQPKVEFVEAVFNGKQEASPECIRYVPVCVSRGDRGWVAVSIGPRRSNQLAALARAAGMMEVPAGCDLEPGDRCRVAPLRERLS